MDFTHTEDRRMLADTLGRFIADRYGIEQRNRIAHSAPGFSADLWGRFAELGTVGALFREEDGGFGGSGFDITVVFEALGRGLVVEPFLGSLMVGQAIAAAGAGAGDSHRGLLAALAEGSTVGALAHDEADSRYSLAHVATRAVRQGDGWQLDGAKAVVRQAGAAGVLLVSARTAGDTTDVDGITLFLVPAGTAGLALRETGSIDGGYVAEVTLAGVELGDAAVLGPVGGGYPLLEQATGAGILALCAESLGAMEYCKDATLDYLRTRKQFNVPIGSFQALQHRMATVLLEIEQARSAVINAAAAFDGEDRVARERALSAAKFSIGRIGTLVAEESIQLHGGIGMTWELPMAHYAKRLVMIDHQLGDEDHHLERYIALGTPAA
ncbi:MAG: acyl-CoA dehydrogenase [Pseudomonadota bacterium]